jgi:hypothetical protein
MARCRGAGWGEPRGPGSSAGKIDLKLYQDETMIEKWR